MQPLSCVNCCHNPLQIGPVGTAFGYCTRHRLILSHPERTTCGLLLRKDLLAESAAWEQAAHAKVYPKKRAVLVAEANVGALERGLAEKPNGQLPADAVIEEVQNYGHLGTKIATMAALHRVEGCRAEVAMVSLSRGYFRTCVERRGKWTSGVHLLRWTLDRLDVDPELAATDLRGPIGFSLAQTIAVARWTVLAFRLALVADVGRQAASEKDPVGRLANLAGEAARAAPPTDPGRLLSWLSRKRRTWNAALSPARYAELRGQLHRGSLVAD
ncbi:MAG: hypothetical protein HY744_04155 [Deltaproteobacteria bacterium]|nr:hypothetical protein [Deltaproteobacteria bacterium]